MDIEKLLEQGKRLRIKPRGYSMYPLIVPGRDEVFVERVSRNRCVGAMWYYTAEGMKIYLFFTVSGRGKEMRFFWWATIRKKSKVPLKPRRLRGK